MSNKYIISIDPGISGGIAVFEQKTSKIVLFEKNPTIKNNNNKSTYDLEKFYQIFLKYNNSKIISESVHSMPGEGSTSSFNFGRSFGQIEGLAYGMKIPYMTVTPQKWKKHFNDKLISEDMLKLKEDLKTTNEKIKVIKTTIKNKKEKTEKIKIETKIKNKIQYHYKKMAKTLSRECASELYVETEQILKKATYDGVADAILIGVYYLSLS